LLESLRDLDRSLHDRGAALVIRRGDVVTEVMRLASECDVEGLFMSEEVSGYARSRRRRLERGCEDAGLSLDTFEGVTVIPPGALTPASGDHYRVFTPYWRESGDEARGARRTAKAAFAVAAAAGADTPAGGPHP
jgi:deoxyribodipyrimidine photo-lyase